jgi:ATP-dependent RNA helicase SUPV3L1/SUV3
VPASEPEMIDINVWWPKDTGPFRKAPERPVRAPRPEGASAKPKFERLRGKPNHAKGKKPERNNVPPPRPPKPEKPMDPNSPFAKLAALKAQMQGK